MDPLPRFQKKLMNNRKRRRDNTDALDGEDGETSNDQKKDKKEEVAVNNSMDTDHDIKIKAEPVA